MTKTFGLNADGSFKRTVSTRPTSGEVTRRTLTGAPGEILSAFAEELRQLSNCEAVILAPPHGSEERFKLVTKQQLQDRPTEIARIREHFPARPEPMFFGLDFDVKDWPADIVERVSATHGHLTGLLEKLAPVFEGVAALRRQSSSSGIWNAVTEQKSAGGQHRYYIVQDGAEIRDFVMRLSERLMLDGWLWGFVSEAGMIFPRTLIDPAASNDVSRLWFEADAVLADPRLSHVAGDREPLLNNAGGSVLDTRALPPLSLEERKTLDALLGGLQEAYATEASVKRKLWRERREAALIAKGVDPEKARRAVGLAVEKHVLWGDFVVELDDGGSVTIDEIIDDAPAFNRKTCADPLEPEYGAGRNLAIIYTDGGECRIWSHAHGGIEYRLSRSPRYWADEAVTPAHVVQLFPDDHHEEAVRPSIDLTGWTEPLDLFAHGSKGDLSSPPIESLPHILYRWALSEARRKGAPIAFTVAASITAVSAAIGGAFRIAARQHDLGYTEPAALWMCLVAPPGSAKSPVISAAVAPLRAIDKEWWDLAHARRVAWEDLKRTAKRSHPIGAAPKERRIVIDDTTIERQIGLHADNPRGLLRAPDELVGMLGSLGAYKKSGDGDRSHLLRMFDGGPVTVDRVTSTSSRADSALMIALAGTQPDKMRPLARDLGADGLLQRFIVVLDDGFDREPIDEAADEGASAEYERIVRSLASMPINPEPIRISPGGHLVLAEALRELRRLRHLPGASDAWRGHVQKWEKIILRLTLILHIFVCCELYGAVDPFAEVDASSVEQAVALSRFLLRHSLTFYEEYIGSTAAASDGREVAGFLLTKPELTIVTRRTIYDAHKEFRGPENLRRLLSCMAELEAAGWVVGDDPDAVGPKRWKVNPIAHVRFTLQAEQQRRDRKQKLAKLKEAGRVRREWVTQTGCQSSQAEGAFS